MDVTIAAISGRELLAEGGDTLFVAAPDLPGFDRLEEGGQVRLYGRLVVDPKRSSRTFRIERIETVSAGAVDRARTEIEALAAAGKSEALFAKGDQLLLQAQRSGATLRARLRALAERAYREALRIERERLDPGDREAVLQLADRTLELLEDRQGALDLLQTLIEPGTPPSPEIAQRLRDLNAVPYGRDGRWVLYEEMKRREGFVFEDGLWLRKEQAAFLEAVRKQLRDRKKPRAGMLPEFFAEAARKGQVVPGLTKRELAAAIGLPDRFDRLRMRGNLYDAWLYDDRGAYYFENDVLFELPE